MRSAVYMLPLLSPAEPAPQWANFASNGGEEGTAVTAGFAPLVNMLDESLQVRRALRTKTFCRNVVDT